MKINLVFFILFFLIFDAQAQTITGRIKSTDGTNVQGASITLTRAGIIVSYTFSDEKGNFKLHLTTNIDSLFLEISYISFLSQKIKIISALDPINITLHPSALVLREVKIKPPPIKKTGDTLNYDVQSFTSKQDRVIGDIIKKLPGIEVDDNGLIKYNGTPISNYYIEGLDLLEEKYNLGNENIKADMVDKVQIIEHNQHLKILDSATSLNPPALNIKLKANAKNKLIVTANAGIGIDTNFLYTAEAIVMKFANKNQFFSGIKANNTGNDFREELTEHFTLDNIDQIKQTLDIKTDILQSQKPDPPIIKSNRYLFNHSDLIFSNGLFSLSKSSQLKYSVNLLLDKQSSTVNEITDYYLPQQTVSVIENQQFKTTNNILKADLKYLLNNPKVYISNKLRYSGYYDRENDSLAGSINLHQQLQNPYYSISNALMAYKKLKTQLVEFNSYVLISKMPQHLSIEPGQFEDVLNNGSNFQSLIQSAALNRNLFSNTVSTKTSFLRFQQKFSIAADYETNRFESDLKKEFQSTIIDLPDSFQNNMHWKKFDAMLKPEFFFNRKIFNLKASFPVQLINLKTEDQILDSGKNYAYQFFLPTFNFNIYISQFFEINGGLNSSINFGNITQSSAGYLLTSYRTIGRGDELVSINKINGASFGAKYRNAGNALFGYIIGSFSKTKTNLVYDQEYSGPLQISKGIYLPNSSSTYLIIANLSKYFAEPKTTISLNISYNNSQYNLFYNSLLTSTFNKSITVTYKANTKYFEAFYLEYSGQWMHSNSLTHGNNALILQSSNQLNCFIFLSKKTTLSSGFSYYWNKANNINHYFFADIGMNYKTIKHQLSLNFNNITNTKSFSWNDISQNSASFTKYKIRPANFVLKYFF